MKEKRYKRMKKAILAGASTGIVTGLLLVGGSSYAFADTNEISVPSYTQSTANKGVHMMRRWNSRKKINSLALNLGLDATQVQQEIQSGKNLKQILQENGIVPDQIHKAMSLRKNKKWQN